MFESRENKIQKGLNKSIDEGATILAKRAEEMISNLKIIDIQKFETARRVKLDKITNGE